MGAPGYARGMLASRSSAVTKRFVAGTLGAMAFACASCFAADS